MDSLAQRLRHQSMDWLAQREYSRHELVRKLQRRFFGAGKSGAAGFGADKFGADDEQDVADTVDASELAVDESVVQAASSVPLAAANARQLIDATLDWLAEQNFQSDERCARLYVRSHIERGHGVLRIRQELVFMKRLGAELVESELAASGCDWFELAAAVLAKRFRRPPVDLKEKAKQLRFLQLRGFSADQCYHALDTLEKGDAQD